MAPSSSQPAPPGRRAGPTRLPRSQACRCWKPSPRAMSAEALTSREPWPCPQSGRVDAQGQQLGVQSRVGVRVGRRGEGGEADHPLADQRGQHPVPGRRRLGDRHPPPVRGLGRADRLEQVGRQGSAVHLGPDLGLDPGQLAGGRGDRQAHADVSHAPDLVTRQRRTVPVRPVTRYALDRDGADVEAHPGPVCSADSSARTSRCAPAAPVSQTTRDPAQPSGRTAAGGAAESSARSRRDGGPRRSARCPSYTSRPRPSGDQDCEPLTIAASPQAGCAARRAGPARGCPIRPAPPAACRRATSPLAPITVSVPDTPVPDGATSGFASRRRTSPGAGAEIHQDDGVARCTPRRCCRPVTARGRSASSSSSCARPGAARSTSTYAAPTDPPFCRMHDPRRRRAARCERRRWPAAARGESHHGPAGVPAPGTPVVLARRLRRSRSGRPPSIARPGESDVRPDRRNTFGGRWTGSTSRGPSVRSQTADAMPTTSACYGGRGDEQPSGSAAAPAGRGSKVRPSRWTG